MRVVCKAMLAALDKLKKFMTKHVYPVVDGDLNFDLVTCLVHYIIVCPAGQQKVYRHMTNQETRWTIPSVIEELKKNTRQVGLWNMFLPNMSDYSQLEYA